MKFHVNFCPNNNSKIINDTAKRWEELLWKKMASTWEIWIEFITIYCDAHADACKNHTKYIKSQLAIIICRIHRKRDISEWWDCKQSELHSCMLIECGVVREHSLIFLKLKLLLHCFVVHEKRIMFGFYTNQVCIWFGMSRVGHDCILTLFFLYTTTFDLNMDLEHFGSICSNWTPQIENRLSLTEYFDFSKISFRIWFRLIMFKLDCN